jgi:hypothetical protein
MDYLLLLWYSQITLYMWYFWILTKAMMTLPSFFLLLTTLCGAQVGLKMKTYLHCIYCKVKIRIQGEKCHTLRSRCACVWICIWWLT